MAFFDFDGTAIVKIVEPEFCATIGFHGEIATGHAKILSGGRIDVKSASALPKDETGNARAIFQGEIVELKDGVSIEKRHGAAFEFHFGAAFVRGKGVALPNRKIQRSSFPNGRGIGHGIFMEGLSETDIALNKAEANDADVRCVGEQGARDREHDK